jgi:MFS family permease
MRRVFQGLGPNVVALGLASFFTDLASEMVFPLMPFFITGTLKASQAWIGLVEGAADSVSSLLRIVSGWCSDRMRRRKPFIFWGYGVSVVARPIYWAATAAWHVLAIRVLDRIGKGSRLAARDALLADSCEPGARGRAFGLQRAMDHLGAALGPLLAAWLMAIGFGVRDIFLLTAIPAAMVLVVIGLLVRDIPARDSSPAVRPALIPTDGNFRWFLATATVFTLANASDLFVILRGKECGFSEKTVVLVWCGHSFLRSILSFPAGALADRVGRRAVVAGGWLVFAACYAGFALVETRWAFVGLMAVYALFSAMGESVARAIVADLVPVEARGTAYGQYWFCMGLAGLPASLGFGLIWAHAGPAPAFLTSAGLGVTACLMLAGVRVAPPARIPSASSTS